MSHQSLSWPFVSSLGWEPADLVQQVNKAAPLPTHPGPGVPGHLPHPRGQLVVREAPVGEGRDVRGTGSSLGEASQGGDLTVPSILVPLEVDGVSRIEGGVLVKEVVGSEEEAHTIPHGHCVGNVLCMWDVQETSCHPGHQILARRRKRVTKPGFADDTLASHCSLHVRILPTSPGRM